MHRLCVPVFAASLLCACSVAAQQKSPATPVANLPKLCVAAVGNGSLKPIQVNEVKAELMKDLLATGLNAESTSTATQVAKKLEISGNNRESIRLRKCDFMLLTSVDSSNAGKQSAQSATETAAAASGNELLLSFALFKKGVEKPLIDTAVNASSAATPTQSIVDVVPKEAEQVRKSFPRK